MPDATPPTIVGGNLRTWLLVLKYGRRQAKDAGDWVRLYDMCPRCCMEVALKKLEQTGVHDEVGPSRNRDLLAHTLCSYKYREWLVYPLADLLK